MRMLFVVCIGLSLMFVISVAWYISNTLTVSLIGSFGTITDASASNTMNLIQYANIAWGPVLCGLVLLWMIASAQARDVESEIYG